MKKDFVRTMALTVAFASLALTIAAVRTSPSDAPAKKPVITVYKDPSCGCCKNWIAHLVKHGYRVDAKDTPNMTEIKRTLGVPTGLTACHTAIVNGYLIEGHVPAADIDRLLAQKPKVAGLAVPGMPAGSPGMEGASAQRYQVLTFDKSGKTTVFANH
ncbi:MAG: DUF411 domain-containing protein [Gemmatimonadaceae bacterium]